MLLLDTMFQKFCLNHILQDFHILQRPLINIDLLDETSETSSDRDPRQYQTYQIY